MYLAVNVYGKFRPKIRGKMCASVPIHFPRSSYSSEIVPRWLFGRKPPETKDTPRTPPVIMITKRPTSNEQVHQSLQQFMTYNCCKKACKQSQFAGVWITCKIALLTLPVGDLRSTKRPVVRAATVLVAGARRVAIASRDRVVVDCRVL